jgi:hypothetical protein
LELRRNESTALARMRAESGDTPRATKWFSDDSTTHGRKREKWEPTFASAQPTKQSSITICFESDEEGEPARHAIEARAAVHLESHVQHKPAHVSSATPAR